MCSNWATFDAICPIMGLILEIFGKGLALRKITDLMLYCMKSWIFRAIIGEIVKIAIWCILLILSAICMKSYEIGP